ncbi:hypothetical protein PM8797T_07257 [Gimesia maris DSM 8797]|uniref:Uncharacterized protein n=1 Tax=Gimesia maris TaxID=122 RepID=A0ABX5YG43_9PLAN|nr:hypothetical protein PM8797T_07257 [Gimesia maris DSM 8797]QDT76973.1 hypothetical protein Mal35_03980 [Gimesia maris]QDU12613.1 hypothetical protein CA11_03930 [Gimesia maris]QEG14551.1 hypothetical protein GmarT_03870 [Gimesia maris]HAW27567.1 hypothetical protein [Planctomycetaceae bacterium]|tara:strand:+ start:1852 stop:2106 length:255 start_codon:yes stop_codon:yes gene_type:complete
MGQLSQQDCFEFVQDVRTTCHQLNNFLTILQCQHDYLSGLSSGEIESELAGVLRDLVPPIESATSDVLELSKKCRDFLEEQKHE